MSAIIYLSLGLLSPLLFNCLHTHVNMMKGVFADSSGYVEINNVKLYFDISGNGETLLYLHGGLSSSRDFSEYIPELSKRFSIITVDRRGHGRSYDNSERYSYSSMADDMSLFLEHFEIDSTFVIGWSDGGVVGYHLASKYPNKVRKLIAFGANYLVKGMTETSIDWITNQMNTENISRDYPTVEASYIELNPDPGNFNNFITNTRDMWLRDPYISQEEFSNIDVPVLLIAGDRDDIRLDQMIEMYSLMKHAQLCILPNTTHFLFDQYSDTFVRIVLEYLQEGER